MADLLISLSTPRPPAKKEKQPNPYLERHSHRLMAIQLCVSVLNNGIGAICNIE